MTLNCEYKGRLQKTTGRLNAIITLETLLSVVVL